MSALAKAPMPLPKSFSYYVQKVASMRRMTTRLLPVGAQSAISPSTTIKFALPENALVDISTFQILFDFVAPALHVLPANLDTAVISSLQLEIGGQQVANISSYNQLMSALWSWTAGTDARNRRAYNQLGNGAVVVGASPETKKVVIQNLLPLHSLKPTLFDTSLVSGVVITINLASKNIMGLAGARSDYTINNLFASIDMISFQGDEYSAMVRSAVNSGMVLEMPYTNAQGYATNSSTMEQTSRFVATSASVDMLVAKPVSGVYDTAISGAAAISTDLTPYFQSVGANVTAYQFLINGVANPAFSVGKDFVPSYNATALCQSQDLLGGSALITNSTNLDNLYVNFLKLNAELGEDEAGRYISGLDFRGTNAQVEYRTSGTAPASGAYIFIWAVCSSLLRIGSGRSLEVVL